MFTKLALDCYEKIRLIKINPGSLTQNVLNSLNYNIALKH